MSKARWQKSLWGSFISRFGLRSNRQSRRRSPATRFSGYALPAAESLESRIVPVVAVAFNGVDTLTLTGPAGADNLRVVSGFTTVGSNIVPATRVFAGAGGNVLVATLTSATNQNITDIVVTGGAAASLTVIGNSSTLTDINMGTTPILTLPNGTDINVVSSVGVEFGSTTITGNLQVDADGAITQSLVATLTVVGTADLDANTGTADPIMLTNNNSAGVPVNSFGSLVLDGAAISIREGNPTNLGVVNATGDLTVFSTSSVTGDSEINVGGITNINLTKFGNITLTNPANTFTTLNLSGANIVLVEDPATTIALGNITASGNLDVTSDDGLVPPSGNSIISSGTLSVAGLATFNTDTGAAVTLTAGTVNFGSISVIAAAAAVTIDEDSATNLDTITAASLSVTSAGAITDFRAASSVTVTGATTLLANAGASAITLDNVTNDFQGTVRFNGTNVTLVDGAEGVELGSVAGASNATTLTVTATRPAGGAAAPIIDTAGAVVTVTGKADLNAIGSGPTDYQAITLNDGTWGGLALRASTAAITEVGGTDLLNCTITGATFSVTATTGNITNGIAPLPGGKQGYHNISAGAAAVSFTTLAAGADITILNAAQVISTFGTLTVTTNAAAGSDASISEGFGTVLAGVTTGGSFTLNAIDGIPTPPTTVLRSVTQTGIVSVGGVTTINASPSFEVNLPLANSFGTSLGLFGRNVTVNEAAATELNFSTIAGNLNLTSTGAITQSAAGTFGRLQVVGTATLSGTSILLDRRDPVSALAGAPFENASNAMGTLFLTSAGDVTIIEKGATTLGTSNVGTAGVADELFIIVSTGVITDAGVITALGEDTTMTSIAYATSVAAPALATLLTAAPAGTIALDSTDGAFVPLPTNNFVGEINLRGTNVVLKDVGSTELGAILATGTLTVTSTGTVTNPTEFVSVGGLATFIKSGAVAADLTLGTTIDAQLGSLSVVGQTAAVSFTNVTLEESNAGTPVAAQGTSLGAMTVAGNLIIDAEGAVTDTGTITVTGTTAITTTADDIILNSTANNFVGDFNFTGAANVSIVDSAGGLQFGAGTSTGATLTVKATGGDVTDVGALNINGGVGAVDITALNNDIQLNNVLNQYGILTLKGATADIAEAGASTPLTLGATSLSGILNLVAGGSVTQAAGGSIVAGDTTIEAVTSVTLTNSGNRLGTLTIGAITQLAGPISVIENDAIVLGEIDVAGALTLTANGTITKGAVDITAGVTTLTAVGKDITLNAGTNSFTSLTVTGQNVSITEDIDALAGTAIGGTVKGNLNLTAAGPVTNNGELLVSGSATIATPSTVLLNDADNQFGSISVTGATNVTIVESGDTKLGILTPSGTLSVTSTGNITDTGVDATSLITVAGGLATFVTGPGASGSGSITLDDDDNNFSTVDFRGFNVTLVDSVAGLVFAGDGSEATTVGVVAGNLNVTAVGAVTQSALLVIDGRTTVKTAGANAIDLDNAGAGNLFGGTVSTQTGSGAIDLEDSDGALDLGATSTTGSLTVESTGGSITQSGAISAGASSFTALANDITLTHINNVMGDLTVSGVNVAVREAAAINIALATVTGRTFALTATTTAAGNAITQTGDITHNHSSATLVNTAASGTGTVVTITSAGHGFLAGQEVTVAGVGGGTAVGTFNGTFTITAVTPNTFSYTATGTGAPALFGTSTLADSVTTLNAFGVGKNIVLADVDNVFGNLAINGGNSIGGLVNIVEDDAVAGTDLAASNISGSLILNSTGNNIDDVGTLKVSETLDLTATGANILLDQAASTFGPLNLAAVNITVTDSAAVDLLDIDATGNFVLIYGGNVTDSGIVDVAGTTTITPQTPPGSSQVILDGVDLNLADGTLLDGAVAITGTTISLTNAHATGTLLGAVVASNALTVNSTAGNIAVSGGSSITAVGLAIFNASDDPDLSLPGGFTPVTRFDILLGAPAATNFNIVRLYGDDANLSGEYENLELADSNLTGNLTISTLGSIPQPGHITDSGTLTIGGIVNLSAGAGGGNITLDTADSTFGAGVIATADLILVGANIYVKDNGIVVLGDVTASGSLTIVSSLIDIPLVDEITQTAGSGVVTTNALFGAFFNAGAGEVDLPNVANEFAGTFSGIGGAGVNIQE